MPFPWGEEHRSKHCSPAALQGWDRKRVEECGLEHSPTKGHNPGHTDVQEKNPFCTTPGTTQGWRVASPAFLPALSKGEFGPRLRG